MLRKDQTEPILQRRQRDLASANGDAARCCIDARLPQREQRRFFRQRATDARQKLPQAEGLRHIICRALIKGAHNAVLVVHHCEKDHPRATRQRFCAHCKAVCVWQLHVDDRQIHGALGKHAQRRRHRFRMADAVALLLQRVDQTRRDHRIVLHQ